MSNRPLTSRQTTHACPGGCDAQVPRHQLACKPCWFRLPADLRNAVNGTFYHRQADPRAHRAALVAATTWYREHPRGGNTGV